MRRFIILAFVCTISINGFSQFENKVHTSVFLGLPRYSPKQSGPTFQNVFNGYKPLPFLGVGLEYAFNTKLSFGANLKFIAPTKENHRILTGNLGLGLKYNLTPSDRAISPFIYSEMNFSHIIINIDGYTESFSEVEDYSADETHATPTNWESIVEESETVLSPVLGYMVGVGLDFTLAKKYGMWVSINYLGTDAHNHANVATTYQQNTSKYAFFVLNVGFKFGFLQSKSLI